MDEVVGRLMEGFYKRNMYNCVNIIIIVDYGIRIYIVFLKKKILEESFCVSF